MRRKMQVEVVQQSLPLKAKKKLEESYVFLKLFLFLD